MSVLIDIKEIIFKKLGKFSTPIKIKAIVDDLTEVLAITNNPKKWQVILGYSERDAEGAVIRAHGGIVQEGDWEDATEYAANGYTIKVRDTGTLVQIQVRASKKPFQKDQLLTIASGLPERWLPDDNTWGFAYATQGDARAGGVLIRPNGTIALYMPAADTLSVQGTVTVVR